MATKKKATTRKRAAPKPKRRGPSPMKTRMFPDGRATLVSTHTTVGAANKKLASVRKKNRGRVTKSPDGFKVWKGAARKQKS